MRRFILPFLVGVLLLTLQTTLLTSLPLRRFRPDLVLIFIIYLGLLYPPISGGLLAFTLGYLMDLFSGNSLGLFAFSRPVIFYLAQFFKGRFYLDNFSSQFLSVLIFTLFEGLMILSLLTVLNPRPLDHLYPILLTCFLPQSFSTGLVTPFLFSLFNKGSSLIFLQHEMGIKERG
ncbi:MAG: rod shape-determining protein MreD [Deltaproteobacteria bacterium RBG_13_47_9]|nr:MAG: rod shape-determining protein MreD [Deltaproteobacteria bacterium RBG_13_47_9]